MQESSQPKAQANLVIIRRSKSKRDLAIEMTAYREIVLLFIQHPIRRGLYRHKLPYPDTSFATTFVGECAHLRQTSACCSEFSGQSQRLSFYGLYGHPGPFI